MSCGNIKIKIIFIAILVFGFFGMAKSSLAATTYYVSPSGSDSSSGSASAPFRTIQKAADIVNPGDTVIVKDGTYTDTYAPGYLLYLRRGGTADNWITFKSENKWGAVLDGQNAADSECISFTRNSNYIRIENFEIRNCGVGIISADNPPATNVYLYGNHIHSLLHHGIDLANGSHYFTIDSNIIHDLDTTNPDWNTYGIYVAHDTSNTTIINNIFYDIRDGWLIHLYQHQSPNPQQNTKIINNTFVDVSPNFAGQIIIAVDSPNLLIENNIFYNPTVAAIRAYGSSGTNIVIRNNITNVANMCIDYGTGYCNYLTFENNQVSTNPLFVDPDNRDYHLQSNSPAIDEGLAASAPEYDIEGALRPQKTDKYTEARFDIGAYEYVGGQSDTTPPATPSGLAVQ